MVQLQRDQQKFADAGLSVVGLSYDSVDTLKKFALIKSITYPLLSDEGSATIRALGLEYKKGLPHPGVFLIGTDGVIHGKLFKEGHKSRNANEQILAMAKQLHEKLGEAKAPQAGPAKKAKPELQPAN